MKIYFAGSIRGGRDDQSSYAKIIKLLTLHGQVLTEHIGLESLSDQGETGISINDIYRRDTKWIEESDVLVAEVTQPSIGVGYEIGYAESLNKTIICLYRESDTAKRISGMVEGNPNVQIKRYKTIEDLSGYFINIFK